VIHTAALVVDPVSVFALDNYYNVNVAGSLTLLRAMAEARVETLVYCSDAAVYGMPEAIPVTEDQPLDAVTPYATSKLMTERSLRDFARAHGLKWAALRVFSVAGADPDGEAGHDRARDPHLLPAAYRAAAGESEGLAIFGTEYDTADGTAVRDFVHVSDVADAHVSALGYLLDGGRPATFNIGSGQGYSVRQVIAAVEQAAGRPVPTTETAPRPGDPAVMVADIEAAETRLDWRPLQSELKDMVASGWRWHAAA